MDATAATVRQAAVARIRERTVGYLGTWVKDADAVQIAMACATRAPRELLEFMLARNNAQAAATHVPALAITEDEWTALFGANSKLTRGEQLAAKLGATDQIKNVDHLGSALRCTIAESSQGAIWSRPWTKAACLLAMHMELHESSLTACLGNLVRADLRRLEDLRCQLDADGLETITISEVLEALALSVT